MSPVRYTLFEIAIGRCGIAWSEAGIVGLWLPESDDAKLRARLRRRHPEAVESTPGPAVREAIALIVALLSGRRAELAAINLDMSRASDFERTVYAVARTIPPGETLTYGDIAERLGDRLLSRDVGQAMGRNPFPIVVPCHRVVAANGRLGGFSAPGGAETKRRMLAIEGAAVGGQPDLFTRSI
jgi:methylated-DNA-[protein]-cysteine S-methyltransferase